MVGFARTVKVIVLSLFLYATTTFSISENSNVVCIESERDALLRFKADLQDPSNRLSSWIPELDCCKWHGIRCDNLTGHITTLNLANTLYVDEDAEEYTESFKYSRLSGKISDSILNLKYLSHLDLSYNDFGGIQIPSFLGSLVSLNYLNLTSSGFQGLIPYQLGNLSNLNHLDLQGHSSFYGPQLYCENLQWLQGFRSLFTLDLSHANLSKVSNWLVEVNMLSSLQELRLSGCHLNHITPLSHVNFTSLSILDISSNYNYFERAFIPKWIFSLTSISFLNLGDCGFEVLTPCAFQNMSSLSHLDLSRVMFYSSIPSCLYTLKGLTYLSLEDTRLRGGISNDIDNLTNINTINLSYNELEGSIPRSMGSLCNLKSIYLTHNKFSVQFSEILGSFSGCLTDSLINLDLENNKIYGHMSNQISELKKLKILNLLGNLISGPIPETIGSLSSLVFVELSGNKLNGTIPESIGSLSSLESLFLFNNRLEGIVSEVPFANLTNLKNLILFGNNLTLRFGTEWVPPFQLDDLRLGSCTLGPKFPKWLKSQTNLKSIDLSYTGISDTVPDWFWNLSYTSLFLSHNKISGMIHADFLGTSVVETIFLDSNMFHGPLPFIHPKVRELNLSNNFFSGRIPDFPSNSVVSIIDISSNKIHDPLPLIPSSVEDLFLSNNLISGNISHFLCHQKNRLGLLILDLGDNLLSGNIPNCWTAWMSLHFVNLSNNNFFGNLPSSMGHLSNLGYLHLSNNSLSGEIPQLLQKCSDLIILDLSLNAFNGSMPAWMGTSLSQLMVLNIRSNELSGVIPNELCHLSSLQIIDIAHNKLRGPIPHCFTNLTAIATNKILSINFHDTAFNDDIQENIRVLAKGAELQYDDKIFRLVMSIDLSENNLSGKIPEEITSLLGLQFLNLSGNYLKGTIPENIGSMTNMESLDFSRNQLSGQIPQSISKLTFLSHLNLSYNNLSGAVPTSTQLQGFDPSSFVGNELCGLPLSKSCKIPETGRTNGEDAKEEEYGNHLIDEWFYLSVGIGFLVGFSCIWVPLFASRNWRLAYSRHLDSIWNKLVSFVCC